jgi:DNA-binding GntR family transcriptional regulator
MARRKVVDNAQVAYEHIREKILDGSYAPGERLTGQDIAEELDLSRTPVREALGQLEQGGLVQKSGWGYSVRVMTLQDIEDLFDVREILEVAAARNAMQFADDEWVASLGLIVDISRTHLEAGRIVESIRAARKMYVSVVERTGNKVLAGMLASINDQIQLVGGTLVTRFPWRATEVLKENQEIVRAFEQRDAYLVVSAVSAHIRRSRELHLSSKGDIRAA